MARYRTIKPELFSDGALSECTRDARLLFIGLFPFVDDMGRRRYSAKQLKNEVFPGDDDIDAQKVGFWFAQLVRAGVVEMYEVGTIRWFRLPKFLVHQRIAHPTHTDSPMSPSENGGPRCLCDACRKMWENGTARELVNPREDSRIIVNPPTERESERESELKSKANTTPTPAQAQQLGLSEADKQKLADFAKDRRAESATLDEIAKRSLQLLEISSNPLILKALTDTIKARSKLKGCTLEAAAQQLMAGAALVKTEQGEPEHWQQWFEDQRYIYVPLGDSRIEDWREHARPVCGGKLCIEGWEPVTVNGVKVLRRCPNCVQAWQDAGRM